MPSFEHEILVGLFRDNGALAAELLRSCAGIAPEPAVARWARRPIELGHPGFRLTPLVIDFADVPRVRDRIAASRLPQLAVLSVMAHPELEIAEIAIEVASRLPEDQARLYF